MFKLKIEVTQLKMKSYAQWRSLQYLWERGQLRVLKEVKKWLETFRKKDATCIVSIPIEKCEVTGKTRHTMEKWCEVLPAVFKFWDEPTDAAAMTVRELLDRVKARISQVNDTIARKEGRQLSVRVFNGDTSRIVKEFVGEILYQESLEYWGVPVEVVFYSLPRSNQILVVLGARKGKTKFFGLLKPSYIEEKELQNKLKVINDVIIPKLKSENTTRLVDYPEIFSRSSMVEHGKKLDNFVEFFQGVLKFYVSDQKSISEMKRKWQSFLDTMNIEELKS